MVKVVDQATEKNPSISATFRRTGSKRFGFQAKKKGLNTG
jgi:hypothetical protein